MTTSGSNDKSQPIADLTNRRASNPIGHILGMLGPLLALAVVVVFFAAADWWNTSRLNERDAAARAKQEAERDPSAGKGNPEKTRPITVRHREPTMLTLGVLRMISVQTLAVAVAALGMTVIIIAGGIDLSAGTALAFTATVLAYCLRENYSVATSILAGIGAGCLTGFLNGALISLLQLRPFIVTLGTMTIYLGVAKMVADETTVRPLPSQVPAWIPSMVTTRPSPDYLFHLGETDFVPNFASGLWLLVGLSLLLTCVLRYTVFGRHIFALGSNESTARLCGINVPMVKIAVYTLSGFFVGIAGFLQFAKLSAGNPTSGIGMELRVIAAVVIGGGSLSGGQGSVLGTLAGAAMMAVIDVGCSQLGLRNPLQDIIVGVIIVAAAKIDKIRQDRQLAK